MSLAATLLSLAAVHVAANASPGPNTLLVSHVAAGRSRAAAMRVAVGLTLGAVAWAAAATLGVGLLARLEPLQQTIRLGGGAYLVWLGLRIAWRGGAAAPPAAAAAPGWRLVRSGMATNLANPASLVFFVGVFAALFPADASPALRAGAVLVIAADALLWYALLALLFSTGPARRAYAGARRWLDRVLGGLLALFGVRLVWSGG